MSSVNCFLCEKDAFNTQVHQDGTITIWGTPNLYPPGRLFKISPFSEYPKAAESDGSVAHPCVYFKMVELRRAMWDCDGLYHGLDFGWKMDQVIYICPSCFPFDQKDKEQEFFRKLDKALIDKIDKEILYLLIKVIGELDVFSFGSRMAFRRRFLRLSGGQQAFLRLDLKSLIPLFDKCDQRRGGKTRKWLYQLDELMKSKKKAKKCKTPC